MSRERSKRVVSIEVNTVDAARAIADVAGTDLARVWNRATATAVPRKHRRGS